MRRVELRAEASERPCPECDGTGEAETMADEPWPGLGAWDCIACHGTGRVLTPIPLARLVAELGGPR